MEEKIQHLYLIDGSAFIFRAFHAIPMLTRNDGTPVNAVYGFCSMLTKLIKDHKIEYIAVVFDTARKNFRNDIYKDYKANRPPPPEELIPQFGLIREAVKAFNLHSIEKEGFEADDIIATYARKASKQNVEVTIVSSDKDLMQLINGHVRMYDPMRNKAIHHEQVIEKFGVPPEKVIDVQSLAGDSTDNVPGVPGIGVKTAAQLINEYGDLDTLLENAEKIKQPKRRQSLIDFAEQARISRELVKLDHNVDVPFTIEGLEIEKPNLETVKSFLIEQNFKTILSNLQTFFHNGFKDEASDITVSDSVPEKEEYTLIQDEKELIKWTEEAKEKGVLAIDTETTSLNPLLAELVGVSLSLSDKKACYIPLQHKIDLMDNTPSKKQIPLEKAIEILKPILCSPSILKIGHNIKYDQLVLKKYGLEITPYEDTMLLSYAQSAGLHGHGLDELAERYFQYNTIKYSEVAGVGKKQVTFDHVSMQDALNYAAEDADITYRLYKALKPNLITNQTTSVYETIDRPLVASLLEVENNGIKIDPLFLKNLSDDFSNRLKSLESEIYKVAGEEFNIASPKQLGAILFEKLAIEGGKKGKSGAYVTNVNVLEKLANDGHPLPQLILDWRQLSKLKSTYTDALINQINPQTKRVHTSFSMAVASTGRLASTDPNLQNIPIRTEEGRKIREAFIAEKGCKLISMDYSQIELRLLAEAANIEALKKAFMEDQDIHAITASEVFNVPLPEMTPLLRRQAKSINFGIIYGISAFGLSKQLDISRTEAKEYIEAYFQKYPGIRQYMNRMKEYAAHHGFVRTLFGRKINLPEIKDPNPMRRNFGERQAVNAPLQGTAADIIKRAMIKISAFLDQSNYKTKMLLQVHDELLFEVPEDEVDQICPLLKDIMQKAHEPFLKLDIPLIVEQGVGNNWAEAH